MDATDVPPSRQAAARAWLARLVDRASPRAVGLVLFAGEPLLTCPLTSDLGALRLALDEAGFDAARPARRLAAGAGDCA